jgi:hypothetical protein
MASDFETTWLPRIGKEATEELRRARRLVVMYPVAVVFAAGASVLIGNGILADVGGAVLAAAATSILVAFVRAQKRIAAALSRWFGVKIKGLPKMNPKRFDAWCQERGLRSPREGLASGQAADALDTAQGAHGSSPSSTA